MPEKTGCDQTAPKGKYQVMPPLTAEERAALKEAIRCDGVLVPVEEDESGNILDGYQRVDIWHELRAEGVKVADYPRIIRPGLTEVQKRAHARALNLARRHLNRAQRRHLIDDQLRDTPETSDNQIAKDLGVDDKTVAKRRRHLEATSEIPKLERTVGADGKSRPARRPAFIVKNGGEARKTREVLTSVPIEDLPPRLLDARQARKVYRQHRLDNPPAVPLVTTLGSASLRHGDLLDALADIPDGSVDLIFTDPPYDSHGIPRYSDLSLLAARVLKDDGLLLAYSGKVYLPQIVAALGEHLDYCWTLALLHGGGASLVNSRCVRGRWKPIFAYVRRGCRRRERWIEDVIHGEGVEKELHAWQQGEAEAATLIEKLTDPGELILEPFLGSGTTAVAAVKLGRRFVGCDINAGAVAIAQERLAKIIEGSQSEVDFRELDLGVEYSQASV